MSDNAQVVDVLLELIEDDEADNPRKFFDEQEIKALALSMQAIGMEMPVILMPGKTKQYCTVDGSRRIRASKLLQKKTIRALIRDKPLDEGERLQHQLIINCQRQDLLPLDKSRGIAQLMASTGWIPAEAAKRLGMSRAGVARALALLDAPVAIQQLIDEGSLSGSSAYEILHEKDPERQQEIARQAASEKWPRAKVIAEVKRGPSAAFPASGQSRSRTKTDFGDDVSVTVPADLTFERFIACLNRILGELSEAQAMGVPLDEFLKTQNGKAKGKRS